MPWFLNRALTGFRSAVNARWPRRDKASDGTIGNAEHQARTSAHNEDPDGSVDAWDMDVDLGAPDNAAEIEHLKRVFEAHPSSKYWIHNDRISFKREGWKPRSYAYAGPNRNRHQKHVHWETDQAHETSAAPWVLTTPVIPREDDNVKNLVLAREKGKREVYVGDGITRRWVVDEDELVGLQWWMKQRGATDTEVHPFEPGTIGVLGVDITPVAPPAAS